MNFVINLSHKPSKCGRHQRLERSFWLHSILLLIFTTAVCHAEVMLRFQSEIHDDAKTLGDIVHIDHDQRHWSEIPLQSQPYSGEIITKARIIDWMTKQLGHLDVHWQGKTNMTVKRNMLTQASTLIAKAQTALMTQLKPDYTRVEVEAVTTIKGSEYALDDFKTVLTLRYPTAKRVCVWLVHTHLPHKRIPIWFKVNAFKKVWVANHPLDKNRLIDRLPVTLKERDIAGLIAPPATSVPNSFMLAKKIARNDILTENVFQTPPLVTHGQPVKVTLHHHQITLFIDAVALNDGTLGETITVKNPLTQKTFTARISGFQQAETTP